MNINYWKEIIKSAYKYGYSIDYFGTKEKKHPPLYDETLELLSSDIDHVIDFSLIPDEVLPAINQGSISLIQIHQENNKSLIGDGLDDIIDEVFGMLYGYFLNAIANNNNVFINAEENILSTLPFTEIEKYFDEEMTDLPNKVIKSLNSIEFPFRSLANCYWTYKYQLIKWQNNNWPDINQINHFNMLNQILIHIESVISSRFFPTKGPFKEDIEVLIASQKKLIMNFCPDLYADEFFTQSRKYLNEHYYSETNLFHDEIKNDIDQEEGPPLRLILERDTKIYPMKLAKEEIVERYGDLNDLPDDLADVISSFHLYKHTTSESEWIDTEMLEMRFIIDNIILKTTEDYLPEQIYNLRNLKKENPDSWKYMCDFLKYSSLYDFNMKIPKWMGVIQTKFQKPYIKVIDGIYKEMDI